MLFSKETPAKTLIYKKFTGSLQVGGCAFGALPPVSSTAEKKASFTARPSLIPPSLYSSFFFLVRQVSILSWALDRLGSSRIASLYSVMAWSSLRCSSKTFP